MKLVALRTYKTKQTESMLLVIDKNNIVSNFVLLELPWNDNLVDHSCIPAGIYTCAKMTNGNYPGKISIRNVPDRTNVQIHAGNYATGNKIDTKGCPMPGLWFGDLNSDGNYDVCESRVAMELLMKILPNVFQFHILELNPEFLQ